MKLSGDCGRGESAHQPIVRVSGWRRGAGSNCAFSPALQKQLLKLHAAVSLEKFWPVTIRVVNAAMPNLFVAACLQDIQIIRPMVVLLNRRVKRTTEYWKQHFQLCPAGPLIQAHPELQMLRITDQLDGVDWHTTEFCRILMKDQGWYYAAIFVLRERGRFLGTVSIQRTRRQGDFSDTEMGLLARLHPLFEVAAQRLLHADAELTTGRAVKQLWDRLPVPAILLDCDLDTLYHHFLIPEMVANLTGIVLFFSQHLPEAPNCRDDGEFSGESGVPSGLEIASSGGLMFEAATDVQGSGLM